MKPYKILGIVPPGLEKIGALELEALNITKYTILKGGIEFVGHQSTLIKCNLMCRVFSRFVVRLESFIAESFKELEAKLYKLPWEDYISKQKICFHVQSYGSKIYHEKAIGLSVLSILHRQINNRIEVVTSPDEDDTQLLIVNAVSNRFTISVDSSGKHLHKRGYMPWREDAPLRETTVAAMLISLPTSDLPLMDPLCGSGTILIEKAVMATKLPLSKFRKFAFQDWDSFQPEIFSKIENKFMEESIEKPELSLIGSDIDAKSIISCNHNAEAAGVSGLIEFSHKDIREYGDSISNHMIVTNPPYGIRIKGANVVNELVKLAKLNEVYYLHPDIRNPEEALLQTKNGGLHVFFRKIF